MWPARGNIAVRDLHVKLAGSRRVSFGKLLGDRATDVPATATTGCIGQRPGGAAWRAFERRRSLDGAGRGHVQAAVVGQVRRQRAVDETR